MIFTIHMKRIFSILTLLGLTLAGYAQMSVFMEDYDWSTPAPSVQNIDNYFTKKKRKDKDNDYNNEAYEYRLRQQREEERRLEAERQEREAEQQRKRRAAQKTREEKEFKAGHEQLKASLHTLPNQTTGLRGQNQTKFGLRGLENNRVPSVVAEPKSETITNNKIPAKKTISSSPKKKAKPYYRNADTYLQAVVDTEPRPPYIYGKRFWVMGSGVDVDDEKNGGWHLWSIDGDKEVTNYELGMLMTWTKKKISATPVGSGVVQAYDMISDAIDIRNTETSIVTRTLAAIKKAILTGDRRYVERATESNKKDVAELEKNEVESWTQIFFINRASD